MTDDFANMLSCTWNCMYFVSPSWWGYLKWTSVSFSTCLIVNVIYSIFQHAYCVTIFKRYFLKLYHFYVTWAIIIIRHVDIGFILVLDISSETHIHIMLWKSVYTVWFELSLFMHKPLVHYLKWSSFVFSVQIYPRMHADLSLAWN